VSQASVVTRLAVRELWITLRMLVILAAFVGAASLAALLPASPTATLERLALGVAAATTISAGLAAWSLAEERISGRAGWLVTRSVSRGTYVMAWFAALASVAVAGLVAAGSLGWIAVTAGAPTVEPLAFVAVVGATAADLTAAVALGLVAGSLARPVLAALGAIVACAVIAVGSIAMPALGEFVAVALLPRVGVEVVTEALRAAGVGLSASAALLVLARFAMSRAEL
jgi:hypothetical protein